MENGLDADVRDESGPKTSSFRPQKDFGGYELRPRLRAAAMRDLPDLPPKDAFRIGKIEEGFLEMVADSPRNEGNGENEAEDGKTEVERNRQPLETEIPG